MRDWNSLRYIAGAEQRASPLREGVQEQTPFLWFQPTIYAGVGGGYISAILTARHLTLTGMILLTATTLAWLFLSHFLFKELRTPRLLIVSALAICACLSLLAAFLAMGCDWPLLVVTAGVIVLSSPLFFALLVSLVLWLASALMA